MEWLNGLLDNRQFALIGAPVIALAIIVYLTAAFIRDRRRIKRGEPFNIWYLKYPVYPDDPFYQYYVWQRLAPPIIMFVLFGLVLLGLGAFVVWFIFWGQPSRP